MHQESNIYEEDKYVGNRIKQSLQINKFYLSKLSEKIAENQR